MLGRGLQEIAAQKAKHYNVQDSGTARSKYSHVLFHQTNSIYQLQARSTTVGGGPAEGVGWVSPGKIEIRVQNPAFWALWALC